MINALSLNLNNSLLFKLFIVILAIFLMIIIVTMIIQWSRLRKSHDLVKLAEDELELRKIAMIEKDVNSGGMGNPANIPKYNRTNPLRFSQAVSNSKKNMANTHVEMDKRLAKLEKTREQKNLEKRLRIVDERIKNFDRKARI
jgi:hypothetical protein